MIFIVVIIVIKSLSCLSGSAIDLMKSISSNMHLIFAWTLFSKTARAGETFHLELCNFGILLGLPCG